MRRRLVPLALVLSSLALSATAQPRGGAGGLDERPGERPPEIPIPEREPPPVGPELAPAPETLPPTTLPDLRVLVRTIQIRGNTLLDDATLRAAAQPYLGRELTTADIEALRQQLTGLYVARGYLTSGALVPDQDLVGGVLQIAIVEGRVATLEIEGNESFRSAYLRERILPDPDAPLDIPALEQRLRWVQEDPDIAVVHAELRPGLKLGESILRVRVEERLPFHLAFDASNDRNPAIGEINGGVRATYRNLVGWGDGIEVAGEFGEGLRDVQALYGIPFTRWDTRLALRFRWSDSDVVESPFDEIDIESDYITGGAELSQPVLRTDRDQIRLGLIAEWRRARSYVDGFGFSFSEGADRGLTEVFPLRPYVEWVRRDRAQVIALRAQVSFGLPVFGATDVEGRREDATFTAGLLQGQWARRFDPLFGIEIFARGDLQLVDDPVFSIEQFSIGGHDSVRGYRENQIVRDNGFDASLEVRVPVWRRPDGSSVLQVAPFLDYGHGWDDGNRTPSVSDTLASVGVGLRCMPLRWLFASLYWGYRLKDVPNPHDSLQDYGLHFLVTATVF